jgi:hypothetical protein
VCVILSITPVIAGITAVTRNGSMPTAAPPSVRAGTWTPLQEMANPRHISMS